MAETLKQFAEKQGWNLFGVVSYDQLQKKLEQHKGIFEAWLKRGFQAEMQYLVRMKNDRYDLCQKLPSVQSVIVLGAWYDTPNGAPPIVSRLTSHDARIVSCYSSFGTKAELRRTIRTSSDEQRTAKQIRASWPIDVKRGVVARYARGKDYHKALRKKLKELSRWLLEKNPQAETYMAVDSSPLADRVLAEAAGLGFFGKNSMIISPSRGSYFFIASLLTNLTLEATPKKRMPSCGSCRRCIDVCPIGAIKSPGVIDANFCISYLTIENRGGIPENLRSKIGNRLFGCDACQEVCPFNVERSGKQEIKIEELKGSYGAGESLDLREIFEIENDEQFVLRFAGTPLMRAKRRGLLRNACVVAGNSGDPALIPYLQKVLERETDVMIKEHAAWAMTAISRRKAATSKSAL